MKKALILIDIQNIYFTEGKYQLFCPEEAAKKAAMVLHYCREHELPVIHIKHLFDQAGYQESVNYLREFHQYVAPVEDEVVIEKQYPSSFLNTNLKETLEALQVQELIIAGMMSHMCIDTTVRAAMNYGYRVTVIEDACTTKNLEYQGEVIPARTVHKAFMAALEPVFAKIITTDSFLEGR